jgi:hypothetical protein
MVPQDRDRDRRDRDGRDVDRRDLDRRDLDRRDLDDRRELDRRDRCSTRDPHDWYDDRFDRRGGTHGWMDPYADRVRGRECDDLFDVRFSIVFGNGRIDARSPGRIGERWAYDRELRRVWERLQYDHERWHRVHGWFPRNRGWVRAHEALHDHLAREWARARW